MAKADGELYAEVGASIGEKRRVIGKEVIEKLGKVILRDRISMSELAAASGVQLPTLRNWFAGKHVPTTKKLQPLCDYLSERWTEADEVELEHYRRLIFGQERGAKL
jgi:transcriptional regulator with XRE-family HTH domain